MDITTDPKTLEFMQHYAVGMYEYAGKVNEPVYALSSPVR